MLAPLRWLSVVALATASCMRPDRLTTRRLVPDMNDERDICIVTNSVNKRRHFPQALDDGGYALQRKVDLFLGVVAAEAEAG